MQTATPRKQLLPGQSRCCRSESVACEADRRRVRCLAGWRGRLILSFIERNSDRSIKVVELSDVARLSASHFSRAFRRSFGEAPRAYLIRQRVDHARHLMLISEMPLSEVAEAWGV